MQHTLSHSSREIYTVSKLTRNIKTLLEKNYSLIWLAGEISNLRIPGSGHAYFSLKDDKSQISSVMFKGQLRNLKFKLGDGAKIIGMGRLSVYEPRGTYQLILEYVEPHGVGALQIAFDQLKKKLESEGLFNLDNKRDLPKLPKKIGVITSPSGAVIKDILRVIGRRFPEMPVDLFPVRVQGNAAIDEIVTAIDFANQLSRCDLVILARGGGSFEDMAAFNSEEVARAIHASRLPIVSAIGHETDFTITDFVADLRAPTPSAAAEMVVPVKNELIERCQELFKRSCQSIQRSLTSERMRINQFDKTLGHIVRSLQEHQQRSDDLTDRLYNAATMYMERQGTRADKLKNALLYNNPDRYICLYQSKLELFNQGLNRDIQRRISHYKSQVTTALASLNALNPTAILNRGYSITRTLPQNKIVTNTNQLEINDLLGIQLAKGLIEVKVQNKTENE